MRFFVLLSSLAAVVAGSWTCIDLQKTFLTTDSKAFWLTQNCSNDPSLPPLLTVNSVHLDLTSSLFRVVPAAADATSQLQTVPGIAGSNPSFFAGINGGYFWRVDIEGVWVDDVCWGKIRKDALNAVDPAHPNYGIGDGLIKRDGKLYSNNCNCTGYSRPAVIVLDGENTHIDVLHRGETVDESVQNALGAGPNLVSYNATSGESYVDIPSDDDNINILEHAANTAVGVTFASASAAAGTAKTGSNKATSMVFVTTDGSDECGPKDYTCGLNSKMLASLLKDHFGSTVAMSMDQGGSTTMWVKGAYPERGGVVSRSHNTRPVEEDGPRNVANGLFVEFV